MGQNWSVNELEKFDYWNEPILQNFFKETHPNASPATKELKVSVENSNSY